MRSWKDLVVIAVMVILLHGLSFGQGGGPSSPGGSTPEGQGSTTSAAAKSKVTREMIRQAVEKAKSGNTIESKILSARELMTLADSIESQADIRTRTDLRPDFEALLVDKQPEVQCLGARGLLALKDPQSKQALVSLLKGKEKNLRAIKDIRPGIARPDISPWEIRASAFAAKALGEVGDQSVIPLLESLQGISEMQVELGHWPVEEALMKLGSLRSLTRLRDGDDPGKIMQAASAMHTIKDANGVPDLIAVVKDPNVAEDIRVGALNSVGAIKAAGVFEFLAKTLDDPNIPIRLRRVAAITMGCSGHSSAETELRRHAEDRTSEIRGDAFVGLMTLRPTAYLDQCFHIVLDVNEVPEFRSRVAGMGSALPRQLLKERKKELYACLSAAYSDGRPFDEIRGDIWMLINDLFHEEPTIVLSTRSGQVASRMRDPIGVRIKRQNPLGHPDDVRKQIDEAVNDLIEVRSADGKKGR